MKLGTLLRCLSKSKSCMIGRCSSFEGDFGVTGTDARSLMGAVSVSVHYFEVSVGPETTFELGSFRFIKIDKRCLSDPLGLAAEVIKQSMIFNLKPATTIATIKTFGHFIIRQRLP